MANLKPGRYLLTVKITHQVVVETTDEGDEDELRDAARKYGEMADWDFKRIGDAKR